MYNEDIKMEFCREVKSTQKSIAWAFARTEPYEVEAGKDTVNVGVLSGREASEQLKQ